MIARAHWGKGYATEAARCCLDWAVERLGCNDLICLTRPGNTLSIGVAEELAMTLGGEIEIMGSLALVYVCSRDAT